MEKVIHGIMDGLHILAAIIWIGSMIYSQVAVKPALNTLGNMKSHALNGIMMKKFTPITWTSLAVLIITGFYGVLDNKEMFSSLTSSLVVVLAIKLVLVLVLVLILFLQVFIYGPKMKQLIMPSTPKNKQNQQEMSRLESITKSMSAWYLGIGIAVVILGVVLSQLLG